jgi:DNA-binding NtrC family response regulator
LLSPRDEIDVADLFGTMAPGSNTSGDRAAPEWADLPQSFREAKDKVVETFERRFLTEALRRHGGNITKAAEEVGMYRQNFQQKMRELGIAVEKDSEI